jgi:phenylalanyl-tRNA synthetase alpha chain
MVLRTHTSPVQIRTMLSRAGAPIRVIARPRLPHDMDQTHTPMFHQVEGLVIDRTSTWANLKGCWRNSAGLLRGRQRANCASAPRYFPFTEPSAEVDIRCSWKGGQLKIGEGDVAGDPGLGHGASQGAGQLRGRPDEWQGFAFGMGIDRIAMLKYGIPDLRAFFESRPALAAPLRLLGARDSRRSPEGSDDEIHPVLA